LVSNLVNVKEAIPSIRQANTFVPSGASLQPSQPWAAVALVVKTF